MKAQITSQNKIEKQLDGTPCYITRITPIWEQRVNNRVYTTFDYESQKEEYKSLIVNNQGEPILDENDEPTFETKTKTVIGKFRKKTDFSVSKEDVNQFGAMIKNSIPNYLSEWDLDAFKRALILQYDTVNDPDFPNGHYGTKEWDLELNG